MLQMVFGSWSTTCHMLCSQSFTLIFHTVFHRMIFRERPITGCPMRNVMVGRKKNSMWSRKSVGGKNCLFSFFPSMPVFLQ